MHDAITFHNPRLHYAVLLLMPGRMPAKWCDAVCSVGMSKFIKPNVVVEWSALLFRIREMPALNLGQETAYSN
jgi:hypothetical protein